MDPFEDCLKKGRLKPVEPEPDSIRNEILIAREELSRARTRFAEKRYEDCLVQSYFAMFRAARALLRNRGYKDTNLYSLLTALRRLYVKPGDLEEYHVNMLSSGKEQKDLVYEGARCNPQDTRALLRNSELFFGRTAKLLVIPEALPDEAPGVREGERSRDGSTGRPERPQKGYPGSKGERTKRTERRSRDSHRRGDERRPFHHRETRDRGRS